MLGTEDLNHKFRLVSLSVGGHGNKETYFTVFTSVKRTLAKFFDYKLDPLYILGDNSDDIYNAVVKKLPKAKYLLCLYHLEKAVNRRISREKNEHDKKVIISL